MKNNSTVILVNKFLSQFNCKKPENQATYICYYIKKVCPSCGYETPLYYFNKYAVKQGANK